MGKNQKDTTKMKTICVCVDLLYAQTEVEDAVGAVGLSIWPPHFFDEARQSKAQLSRVTLKDVFFDMHSIGCMWRQFKIQVV